MLELEMLSSQKHWTFVYIQYVLIFIHSLDIHKIEVEKHASFLSAELVKRQLLAVWIVLSGILVKSTSKLNSKIHALENLKQIPLILLTDVCYWSWNNYFIFKINFKVLHFILYSKTDMCMQVSFTLYWEDRTISPADPWDSEKYQLGPQAESSQIFL